MHCISQNTTAVTVVNDIFLAFSYSYAEGNKYDLAIKRSMSIQDHHLYKYIYTGFLLHKKPYSPGVRPYVPPEMA